MFPCEANITRKLAIGLTFTLAIGTTAYATATTTFPAATVPAKPAVTSAPATEPVVTVPVPVIQTPATPVKSRKKITSMKIVNVTTFIGQINATHVNIRSGPGLSYYTLGQLAHGDLIQITGERNGWYRFAAPAGSRCYVARQYVKLGADGTTGTITGSFVNVRAASALSPRSNYAVVDVLNAGATVSVTGQTPAYDIIRAPKGTGFYILARFISPASADTTYVTPELKMPAGHQGPGLSTRFVPAVASTVTNIASTATSSTNSSVPSVVVPAPATTQPATTAPTVTVVNIPGQPPVAATYNANTYSTYTVLNRQMQEQFNKPILQRQLQPLLAGFENLLAQPKLPSFVHDGITSRIKVIKKQIAIQEIVMASHQEKPLTAVIAPYQQQWEQSQKELAAADEKAPYIAYGIIKTSTVLKYYALEDPVTGRVVAYLEPESTIDISKLLGSYIGVKGEVTSSTGLVVRVIKVTTATMFPLPSSSGQAAPIPSPTPTTKPAKTIKAAKATKS